MVFGRLITLSLLILLVFPLCFATDFYAQNVTADIRVPCINNETYCSPSAVCNISIFYPNNTLLVDNVGMTNNGNFFNYSLTDTQTLGLYRQQVVGSDNGQNGYSLSDFRVTKDGLDNEQNGLNVIGMIVSVIFVIILFIGLGLLFQREHPLLGVPLVVVGFVMIILLVNVARIGLDPNMEVADAKSQMGNFYGLVTEMIVVVIIYIIGYILFSVIKHYIEELKKNKQEKQGWS